MHMFVAGASGALGIPIVIVLLRLGHRVTAMTCSESGSESLQRLELPWNGSTHSIPLRCLAENEALRKPIEELRVEAAGSSRRHTTHPRFPHTGGNIVSMTLNRATDYIMVFLRIALGIAFLSAVADRFGLWGTYGQPNVEWGDFSRFVDYTGQLNWFAPTAVMPALAWAATFAEILLGLALVFGFFTRVAAWLSGLMLVVFALTMTFALGVKAPLNYSVFSSCAGAFLLAAYGKYLLSIDALKSPRES